MKNDFIVLLLTSSRHKVILMKIRTKFIFE